MKNKLKKAIVGLPLAGRLVLLVYRMKTGVDHFRKPLFNLVKWIYRSNEITNFTYDLDQTNKRYLASMIADLVGIRYEVAIGYINEIEEDRELREHVARVTQENNLANLADKEIRLGRRVGWYALARSLKPKIIVETGVEKGLGSCVLAAALMRNKEEGFDGRYFGTDINQDAGYLFVGKYADYGSILYGDSIDSLRKLSGIIDLFINDSDHSPAYEAEEYRTIEQKLSQSALVLGDNCHCTDKLLEFSLATDRQFLYFQEKPIDHWYQGAGIGISFRRNLSSGL